MIERMADLVKNKIIEGITDIRDESNREGIRVVIELRKDVIPEVILNQLYKYSSLQTSYSINMLALDHGQPKVMPLKDILIAYLNHQEEVILRRTNFELEKAEERKHILEGLKLAGQNIDDVINIIKSSKTREEARNSLIEKYGFSEKQVKAILEMQLQRLTGIEQDKIDSEIHDLNIKIDEYNEIIHNHDKLIEVIRKDLLEIKEKYNDERRTTFSNDTSIIEDESLIPQEDIIIKLTQNGYIKRVATDTYRSQNRGGRGVKGMSTHEDDVVEKLVVTNTHTDLLFFTNYGKVYRIRGHQVPEYSRQGKGLPVVNLLHFDKEEKVKAIISADTYNEEDSLLFVTEQGIVKRVSMDLFANINKNGKIAVSLKEGDMLFDVKKTNGSEEVFIASSNGKVVRFNENDVRRMGRTASGVTGINLDGGVVVGSTVSSEGDLILVITSKGYGKMSRSEDYRLTSRGGKGVLTLNATERVGNLVAMRAVKGDEDLLITTDKGIIIRTSLSQVKIAGRNTQGVKVIKLDEDQSISSIAVTDIKDELEEETTSNETNE